MLLRLACVGLGVPRRPAPCGLKNVENTQEEFGGGGGGDCPSNVDSTPEAAAAASMICCTCPESTRVTVGEATFRATEEEDPPEPEEVLPKA